MCVCTVYIYYVYTNTCMYIFKKNMFCKYRWPLELKIKISGSNLYGFMTNKDVLDDKGKPTLKH